MQSLSCLTYSVAECMSALAVIYSYLVERWLSLGHARYAIPFAGLYRSELFNEMHSKIPKRLFFSPGSSAMNKICDCQEKLYCGWN